ncbi:hypothetical protein [Pararhizobium sp. O133]|uniref:hypothetical protein n=1 Tax=Pararhizobium sp. O133 TaxID=3449278 RepID=UPI003F685941
MTKPVLSGPYFILPASHDALRLHELAKAERLTDYLRGYVCGAVSAIALVATATLVVRWLA